MADTTSKTDSNSGPTDALRDAGQQLLGLLVQRAAQAATDRVTGLTDRLGTCHGERRSGPANGAHRP